jgi:hypothetical protein
MNDSWHEINPDRWTPAGFILVADALAGRPPSFAERASSSPRHRPAPNGRRGRDAERGVHRRRPVRWRPEVTIHVAVCPGPDVTATADMVSAALRAV